MMIYLYCGENDFALAEKLATVKQAFVEKYGATAVERLDGGEIDDNNLVGKMVNIDMFTPRKLLIISNAGKKPTTWEKLAHNLARVPDSTEVILIEKKPDGRLNSTKTIKKIAKTTEFKALKPWEVVGWTKTELQRQKMEVKRGAVDELALVCGYDQWRLRSEIKKLSALTQVLTSDIVKKYVEAEVAADAFKVLELAFRQDREAMNAELANLRHKESAERFLGLLAGQIFALAAIKNADGRSQTEVARAVGVHPFVMQKIAGSAQKTSQESVREMAQGVANIDAKMKMGVDGWDLLTTLLNKLG
jgi:DNA polymerase-3 subunit delta